MRTITVITTSRADFGIYLPVLSKIQRDPELALRVVAAGMHLSQDFGYTADAIEAAGFEIQHRVEMLLSSDSPASIAKSMGLGVIGYSEVYAQDRPDLLLVLGDRFEMHAAALAALPFKIPVAHIHGGEVTEGAIDDALRHGMTKLSHLHFVANDEYARRVEQLGEEPWRITVSGAPALDNLHSVSLLTPDKLEARFDIRLDPPPVVVTYHPVTLEYERTDWQVGQLLEALEEWNGPVVFTQPNADTGGRQISELIDAHVEGHDRCWRVDNMGTQGYFSLMSHAAAMVGNSSSGLLEAASFKLPVVNVGTRQKGRVRPANVIDVDYPSESILEGLRRGTSDDFVASLADLKNPNGDGQAADRITERLKTVELGDALITKRFVDLRPA